MRVVHLTNALCWDGTGHTNSTIELAIGQAVAGDSVVMVCRDSDERTRALAQEFSIHMIEGINARSLRKFFKSRLRLRNALKEADVLHAHTVKSLMFAAAASPLGYWSRSVSTLHNPHQRSSVALLLCRRVVALNQQDARRLRNWTLGMRRPAVINNGMIGGRRLPAVQEVEATPLPDSSVVFVGALHYRKGIDILLHAMRLVVEAVPSASLYIIGNRDNFELEDLSAALGLEKVVHFVGFVDDPRSFIKSAAVFVLPSRAEGFGNVILEARSCGVPIVASRVGGIPEALGGEEGGLLVKAGDSRGLATALIAVLSDKHLARNLAASSLRGINEASVDRAVGNYALVYASLVG